MVSRTAGSPTSLRSTRRASWTPCWAGPDASGLGTDQPVGPLLLLQVDVEADVVVVQKHAHHARAVAGLADGQPSERRHGAHHQAEPAALVGAVRGFLASIGEKLDARATQRVASLPIAD